VKCRRPRAENGRNQLYPTSLGKTDATLQYPTGQPIVAF
jgi:hypothetical protein